MRGAFKWTHRHVEHQLRRNAVPCNCNSFNDRVVNERRTDIFVTYITLSKFLGAKFHATKRVSARNGFSLT